jgi:hypothetical protein
MQDVSIPGEDHSLARQSASAVVAQKVCQVVGIHTEPRPRGSGAGSKQTCVKFHRSFTGTAALRVERLSQKLTANSQKLPSKEKPHRTCPRTYGTNPMRLAQGWAGVWRRAIWFYNLRRTIPGQVRVLFFLARNAR